MIYPIVKFGNPVLEKPAEPVTVFDDELKKLVEDMFESMYEAQGVGLAAPQIGISKQLAVIDVTFKEDPDAKLVLGQLIEAVRDRLNGKTRSNTCWRARRPGCNSASMWSAMGQRSCATPASWASKASSRSGSIARICPVIAAPGSRASA